MPWVRNGTVSVTNGSASVTGASTTFQGSGVLPGHTFIGPDARLYEVLTVTSNTAMTIAPNYLGSTAAGQAYQIDTGPDALGQTVYQRVLELLNWIGGSIPAASAFLGTPSTQATTGSVFAARGVRAVFESASEFLLRVSRASSSHAAMLVFDDANSGRWRVGMKAASADLYIQRSADGTTFTDAVEVNATTGAATFLGGIVGGVGDVTGPTSSVNNRIAVFSGTTGKIIADSGSTTASFAPVSHTHTAAQITDFNSALVGVNDTNRILNPAMRINQSDVTSLSSGGYIADVWLASNITAASWTTNVPTGFPRSIEFTGSNFPFVAQRLERSSVLDLVGQQITVSFWAQNVSGTTDLLCDILTANAIDNFASSTSHQSVGVAASPSTSWTRYSATFNALPSAAANGIELRIGRGTGSASTTRVTGVELVAGTSATPFKFRNATLELLLVQRNYFRLDVGADIIQRALNQRSTTGDVLIPFVLPVTMRATPALSARGDINDGAPFTSWDSLSSIAGGPWVLIRKVNVPSLGFVDLQALTADARL